MQTATALQPMCQHCGRRHFAWSHTNDRCTVALRDASAPRIAARAASYRQEAELALRCAAVAEANGTPFRAARDRQEAMALYAKAYEEEV